MKKINLDSFDKQAYDQKLLRYLDQYVTDNKKRKFEQVLNQRTRHLTFVVEDIFKSHNASAVMRTAECLGLQDVHVVEQNNKFDFNPYVLRGSGKWLTVHHHKDQEQNVKTCFAMLREQGYQILATSPREAVDYREVDLTKKTAVVFGAEEIGISNYVKEHADQLITIPMAGFTESFNISVSAAIVLEFYNHAIRKTEGWQLSSEEKFSLLLEWYQKVVPKIDMHLKYFEQNQTKFE
ncbi:tRNA (guanosine-2'-O-)-methyltransferase [Reichenbachiella agariperforans]|uniref:tRNA (guanosine(18)-2'-O)-methyltransferase n=1 Tax=Reichenbachiella agariperforans TaxID=156994 RepID=A0A1M6SWI6_REIAG|nr:RNA methyltransferase [Reichenbachiella agariperforans]SHK49027.1 tRNA (guanosine-2'-O-)-methyltransferase [Reichenbachiella agariperforans]